MIQRLRYLVSQPDFRAHRVRAIWRRLLWRFYHATHPGKPLILEGWYQGMRIALPRSGCAAQVFYRRHSNPEIVRVMEDTLREGDTVIDIGAHIGEYTLIAAYLVGSKGQVHAVEPQPHAAEVIAINASLNQFSNIRVHQVAVGNTSGIVRFSYSSQTWGGLIVSEGGQLSVRCVTLDELVEEQKLTSVRLVKVDAAGNEKDVLLGGRKFLTGAESPIIICKFYNPTVVRERFGYETRDIVKILHAWGYQVKALTYKGEVPITADSCYGLFQKDEYGFVLKAWRSGC